MLESSRELRKFKNDFLKNLYAKQLFLITYLSSHYKNVNTKHTIYFLRGNVASACSHIRLAYIILFSLKLYYNYIYFYFKLYTFIAEYITVKWIWLRLFLNRFIFIATKHLKM